MHIPIRATRGGGECRRDAHQAAWRTDLLLLLLLLSHAVLTAALGCSRWRRGVSAQGNVPSKRGEAAAAAQRSLHEVRHGGLGADLLHRAPCQPCETVATSAAATTNEGAGCLAARLVPAEQSDLQRSSTPTSVYITSDSSAFNTPRPTPHFPTVPGSMYVLERRRALSKVRREGERQTSGERKRKGT